jgi:PhnB protein
MPQALTAYLVSPSAATSVEFYKQAFGAEELARHLAPDGRRLMHVHLCILGSDLMLSDDFCDKMGGRCETPAALGGNPVTLHLQVEDADAIWNQAITAGATILIPLADQFWGDRYGQLVDPFGYKWSIGQTQKRLTTVEIAEAAAVSF